MKKYTLLRGPTGNRFFILTGDHTRESIVKVADGTVAYTIIGEVDTIAEAQRILYGYVSTQAID